MPDPTPTHIKRLETLEDAITAISDLSNKLEKLERLEMALKHITRHHTARVVWHSVALVLEIVGTIFVLLGAMQFRDQVPASGIVPADATGYQVWYYHQEVLGIVLLFSGILAQCCVVFFQSITIGKASKVLSAASAPIPLK
jgi:hypothetical protein